MTEKISKYKYEVENCDNLVNTLDVLESDSFSAAIHTEGLGKNTGFQTFSKKEYIIIKDGATVKLSYSELHRIVKFLLQLV